MLRLAVILLLVCESLAYRPLQEYRHTQYPIQGPVGDPLYLTPYILAGDLATARELSRVTDPLVGVESNQPESYSGYLTVKDSTNSNMFFWFFPATDVDSLTAPIVLWLQGGPGGSTFFGLLEINGPIQAVKSGNSVTGQLNPYSWTKKANVIYIDNPVGAGYSYADSAGLPTTQAEASADLYEALIQWFTLFSEYQPNEFYPFGESYGGKFAPTIAKKIHDENPSAAIKINLAGVGVGDGFMSPPDSAIYADYLYQAGLVDEGMREDLLTIESSMKQYCAQEQWRQAWNEWNNEFGIFLSSMGCSYYYEFTMCDTDPEEQNYDEYAQLDQNRLAIHVGDRPFGTQSGDVYQAFIDQDFMRSERDTIEFLLDNYKVLIYNGNFDIICNHPGVLEMFAQMTTWSGLDEYKVTEKQPVKKNGDTVGYLKSVQNLRLFTMRNAGHMVPRNQPEYSLDMLNDFLDGSM